MPHGIMVVFSLTGRNLAWNAPKSIGQAAVQIKIRVNRDMYYLLTHYLGFNLPEFEKTSWQHHGDDCACPDSELAAPKGWLTGSLAEDVFALHKYHGPRFL